ncbi:MAG: AIR synthase-related protein [Patescibacteria group bacterium]|nr:phosphoribosylformylglycinamidine synthase [Patescibacteria group bacterium]
MPHRIEVLTKVNDTRSEVMRKKIEAFFPQGKMIKATVIDVYVVDKHLKEHEIKEVAEMLANPISQTYELDKPTHKDGFNWALEIGFLPGVTDNIGHTAKEEIEDLLKVKFADDEGVYTATLILIEGDLEKEDVEKVGNGLANKLIQRIQVKSHEEYAAEHGMGAIVPRVKLQDKVHVDEVDIDVPEEELLKLGKEGIPDKDGTRRGPLALDKDSLCAIQTYYKKEGRKPTDVELESVAQTWSEHCKHTIFAAKIDDNEEGLYKGFIKKATIDIRNKKGKDDFCVSVFVDNSGGILFDENWVITDKAETHNTPSTLDPFGGAITGIVGVNRDTIGFGLGAKPIINKYGYCVGDPFDEEPIYRDKDLKEMALSPGRILEGIVAGVNAGGNCSGIPTPQGFVYFDDGYKGKPLVFVGTVGLLPRELNRKPSWEKKAHKGDKVVMVGGRVGQDGIHGATFSSEVLTEDSPATAVQIGDPITQKKFSDAIVKEARQLDLYNSITDNGAGGLSCSVAEMAKECGGCDVDLDRVPLKYPNLEPWKIWISESQERMTLAIPEEKLQTFMELMERRGVEATVIGEFTDSGRCVVKYKGEKIMDLDMHFLHDGLPRKTLTTQYTKVKHEEPDFPEPSIENALTGMASNPNVCGFSFISRQYDHEVQGGSVIKPLQGKGEVNGTASVTKPFPASKKGIISSQALNPKYSAIDTYHMAACAIDTAIRNNVAVGGNVDYMAIMDNFCWCSSDEKERLGQLKATAQACYDYAVKYGTPYISGKDSMYNDFKGYDAKGRELKISVPPTLLISSLSVMRDVTKAVSLDAKIAGDIVYIIGMTKNELGGSEYFSNNKFTGNEIPKVDAEKALELYRTFKKAVDTRLLASAISLSIGGLGAGLMKTAIGGMMGMEIDLRKVPQESVTRTDFLLFSESQTRFVVTVDPKRKDEFEKHFKGHIFAEIGKITDEKTLKITGLDGEKADIAVKDLHEAYHKTFNSH